MRAGDITTFEGTGSLLHFAAYISEAENCRLLLDHGADPNLSLPTCGSRPLHHLFWRISAKVPVRTIESATMLLDAGADPSARLRSGLEDEPIVDDGGLYMVEHGGATSLHHAARFGDVPMARLLLSRGANVNVRTRSMVVEKSVGSRWRYERRDPGLTPLHMAAQADDKPITSGHVEVARLLLDHGSEIDARAQTGNIGVCTPLHIACFSGADRAPIVRLLLERGANPNVTSSEGTTPLFDAARHFETEICEVLLAAGAKPTIYEAVAMDRLDLVDQLLRDDPDALSKKHPYTKSTVWPMARTGWMRSFLLSRGSSPTIHEAAELGWTTELRRQLSQDRSLVNARSEAGKTPLHHAISWNHLDAARLLLKHGADPEITWSPGPGWNALELARRRNRPEMIQLIEAHPNDRSLPDKALEQALAEALRAGDQKQIEALLEDHPTLATAAIDGYSMLHHAAGYNNVAAIKLLIEYGANPNAMGITLDTPLAWAVRSNWPEASQALIDAGAKVDLFCAAGMGLLDRVKSMLDGVDPTAPVPSDILSDALRIATNNGRTEVVEYLVERGAALKAADRPRRPER